MSVTEATEPATMKKLTEESIAALTAGLKAERAREEEKNKIAAERRKARELKAVESYYSNLAKYVREQLSIVKWREMKTKLLLKTQKAWNWIPLFKNTPELLEDKLLKFNRRREELQRPLSQQANFYHPNSRHIGDIVKRYPEETAGIPDRYERNS